MTMEPSSEAFVMRQLHTLEEIGLTVAVVLLLLTPMLDPVVSLVTAAGLLILLGVLAAGRPGAQHR
ncbi:MAG: hypothetical protein FIA92_11240 [Chloroflexi bacterium]|nr:hypothetical protein [Chloroflexota bacterium]